MNHTKVKKGEIKYKGFDSSCPNVITENHYNLNGLLSKYKQPTKKLITLYSHDQTFFT